MYHRRYSIVQTSVVPTLVLKDYDDWRILEFKALLIQGSGMHDTYIVEIFLLEREIEE